MQETRNRFLAFSFGDYEGVRQYLDTLAREGWELTGRAGLFTGQFQRSRRQELIYDVVPAGQRRSQELLDHEVQLRHSQGWEPVDTIWGMDIYKSLPCQSPEPLRREEDRKTWQKLFRDWLLWSLAFLGVTLAVFILLSHVTGIGWTALSHQWYLSDSRALLCLALPLEGILAVLWLIWLLFCLLVRWREHRPAGKPALFLRGGLQLLALGLIAAVLLVLWLDQIPRLWVRLLVAALFLLALLAGRLVWRGNRQRQILAAGLSVFACFLLSMVLGWTLSPVQFDTFSHGSSWRQSSELTLLTREDLGLETEGLEVMASYDRSESLLVQEEHYYESWSDGTAIEATVYTCALPPLAKLVQNDLVPEAAQPSVDFLTISGDGWHRACCRVGRRVIWLSGTLNWTEEGLLEAALAQLS